MKEVYAQYLAAAETLNPETMETIAVSSEDDENQRLDPLQMARKRRRRIQAAAEANRGSKRVKNPTTSLI